MIKAEDLRIGDLVIVSKTGCKIPKGTVCRVTAIETESMLFDNRFVSVRLIPIDPKCKQISWYDWCKNISPIPLTPGILEKNGFKEDVVGECYTKSLDNETHPLARYLSVEWKSDGWSVFIK